MKLKRRLIVYILILAIACAQAAPAFAASAEKPELAARSAIVMDAGTGKILFQKDAGTKRQPASTTKIVTCMLALDKLDLNKVITVRKDATRMGNIMEVKKGEQLTVEQLLYALMVYSANDAAVVLAEEMGGTVENFAKMMDKKARECGAKNSHFLNPNGLNWQGQEAHLTTAYDLAVITRRAMKNKMFRKLARTVDYTIPATNKSEARKLKSTNKCLWDAKPVKVDDKVFVAKYKGTMGVKTGLTSTAGGCFVGAVDRNGTELISVVLYSGIEDRFDDTIKLWDYTLDKFYDTHVMVKKGERVGKVRVKRGAHRNVRAVAKIPAAITVPKGDDIKQVRAEFVKMKLSAPVKKGDKVGTIKIYDGKKLMSVTDAVADKTIEQGGPLSYIGIPDWFAVVLLIAAILAVLIFAILRVLGRRPGDKSTRRVRRSRRRRRLAAREKRENRDDV